MLYLSDKITINYSLAAGTTYDTYTVSRQTLTRDSWTVIYTGRAYRTAATQTLYLNDIIENHSLDATFFGPGLDGNPDITSTSPACLYMTRYKVDFGSGATYTTDWVLSYHKDFNIVDGSHKVFDYDALVIDGFDILQERTTLLPRIPDLPTTSQKFWVITSVIPNYELYNDSTDSSTHAYVFDVSNGSSSNVYVANDATWRAYIRNHIEGYTMFDDYYALTHGKSELFVKQHVSSGTPWSVKIANIDSCPADYYVIWMDRTGAYQCQPFTKRVDYSETISTSDVVNAIEESRPYLKQVTSSWTLNSDWMGKDDRKAFESLLVSPYIYLYDTKQDLGWWVNCTDSSWEDKLYKNGKQMFNFSVTLKAVASQNIVY